MNPGGDVVESSVVLKQGIVISVERDGDTVESVTVRGPALSGRALRSINWDTVFAIDRGDLTALFLIRVPTKTWTHEWCEAVVAVARTAILHDLPILESMAERLGTTPPYAGRILARLRRQGMMGTIAQERIEHGKSHTVPLDRAARDFRAVRDQQPPVASVRKELERRWRVTPHQVAAVLRKALDEGYLTEEDKIAPGRPRSQP